MKATNINRMLCMLTTTVFLLSLSVSFSAHALVNFKTDGGASNIFEGPAAVALGGAGLAAKSANESGHMNPATLPLLNGTHFGAIYGAESTGPRAGSNKYHLVVAEATDEVACPGALTYSKVGAFKDGREVSLQEIHGALGIDLSDHISVGTAVKYLTLEGQHIQQVSAINGMVGLLVTPHRNVGIAFVYDDFMNTKEIPTASTLALGGHYIYERYLRVRLDTELQQNDNPNRRLVIKAGLETMLLAKDVNLRFGYRWDEVRTKKFAAMGIGWQGPRLGLNYAYEKDAGSEDFRHLIDMLVQF
jgi:hypothetical protein